ncbi:hypothetical protein PPTG_22258 [Phytophthora nicotianae INRA-310]|uniref:Uncharacterized protein n=1 Tax=Phytophthora nicotianae (strain INRA-310) TaxID=761204 RepID=W2QL05_PHYN3|nr:hypothetical protein PPTG_22258 [Phytophthora nicotianae INRA-310]ETN13847.1 hypothetical protein PPTG_22258 [Phytophthora nicotianae INRA-310]
MDCTYKTNKFDLPLLNVISLTGMDTVIRSRESFRMIETKR